MKSGVGKWQYHFPPSLSINLLRDHLLPIYFSGVGVYEDNGTKALVQITLAKVPRILRARSSSTSDRQSTC